LKWVDETKKRAGKTKKWEGKTKKRAGEIKKWEGETKKRLPISKKRAGKTKKRPHFWCDCLEDGYALRLNLTGGSQTASKPICNMITGNRGLSRAQSRGGRRRRTPGCA
jgi:hypothetical protein